MPVINVNDQEFAQQLNDHHKVIVKYYADWCGSCKLFAPKFRRLSEDERFEGITFLDVNAETNEQARKMAGVDNLPFIAVFKNGELLEGMATSKEEKALELLEKLN
jgi:thiol-disulfide isomerase/thioredoxin